MSCETEKKELDEAKAAQDYITNECENAYENKDRDEDAKKQWDYCRWTLLPEAQKRVDLAKQAFEQCERENAAGENAMRLLEAEGLVTFLRINNVKTGFGGGKTNWIDAEVIFSLDSHPGRSFGFKLRDDNNFPVRQGMLALLRDAIIHDLKVKTDYVLQVEPPNQNCFATRIAVSKSRVPASAASGLPNTLAPTG